MSRTVVAHFNDLVHVDRVVDDLVTSGISPDAIRVVTHEGSHREAMAKGEVSSWGPAVGTALGAAVGVALVFAAQLALAHGAHFTPGAVAAALFGGIAGSLLGAFAGALLGIGRVANAVPAD